MVKSIYRHHAIEINNDGSIKIEGTALSGNYPRIALIEAKQIIDNALREKVFQAKQSRKDKKLETLTNKRFKRNRKDYQAGRLVSMEEIWPT